MESLSHCWERKAILRMQLQFGHMDRRLMLGQKVGTKVAGWLWLDFSFLFLL